MTTSAVLTGYYDYRLVALSILIVMLSAYAFLDLAGRVASATGRIQLAWLCGGAATMGIGIWAMHSIGMEAFHLPIRARYDWPTILISLLAVIVASGITLFIVSRPTAGLPHTLAGSSFLGGGIAAVHYIGMSAMRLPASRSYTPWLVFLSVVFAIAISFAALRLALPSKGHLASWGWRRFWSGFLLGIAIPVMHYVGMAAVVFTSAPSVNARDAHAVSISILGLTSIAIATLTILGLVFLMSMVDRRFSLQARQLAESQSQLQAIFDNMTEGIVVLDSSRNIVQINQAAIRLLGLPDGPLSNEKAGEAFEICMPDGEVLSPKQWPGSLALGGKFLRSYEMKIRHRNTGKIVIVEISTAPITYRDGEPPQVIIGYRDITERKQSEEARTRLAAIVESSEDAIIGKDERGVVTSWNSGAVKIFGYTADEMIGQSITRLLPPGREQEEEGILGRIKRGETVEHIETMRKRKDGQLIHVSLTISPIKDASNRVIGASKIARNITEKKQLEHQLHQSQKMEAIGQLTGGIAHDFNNLLGVVIGNLDLLERLVFDNEAALKRVQTAQKAAVRGADLTRRLLAFSSKEDLRPSATLLDTSIQNMIELAARALGPEIKITTCFDESVPPVFIDVAGLESALLNLVVNARDAMPKGGSLTITTRLSNLETSYPPVLTGELPSGRYACISVSDTGHGMSRETLERAFEPFFTTKPRGKGTGLGLAMVYGFVKQSDGTVRIYSEPGYGTTVSLYLPLAKNSSQPAPIPVTKDMLAKAGGTILVVDDEVDLLEIAVAYLVDMGYTALRATDGARALKIVAEQKKIDLMVTDIIMPGGINGVELAQRVRQLAPEIKIVYSSGFPADALAERSGTLVDGPLLHKPYHRTEFGAIIRHAMEGSGVDMAQDRFPDPDER